MAMAMPSSFVNEDGERGEDFFSSTPPLSTASTRPALSQQPEALFRGDDDDNDADDAALTDMYDGKRDHVEDSSSRKRRRAAYLEPTKAVGEEKPCVQADEYGQSSLQRTHTIGRAVSLSPSSSISSKGSAYGDWDRRYVGNFVVPAYALSKGSNYVSQGDKVKITRQKPKGAAASSSSAVRTYAEEQARRNGSGHPKKQAKLNFASAVTAPAVKTGKVKEDHIVRFSNMRGFEVGRIPAEIAVWMSKVIDNDAASFEGVVVDCPPVLTVGCDMLLEVRAYILRDVFNDDGAAGSALGKAKVAAEDLGKAAWRSETAETEEEKRLRERKVSLLRLFGACTLRPSKSNAILKNHHSTEQLDENGMLEQYGGASQILEPKKSSSPALPRSSPQSRADDVKPNVKRAASYGSDDSPPGSTPDPDDGTEMTENQLDSVYNRAQQHDVGLPEVEPAKDFALTLRPYQKQALGWMRKMEEKPGTEEGGREATGLHPLWEEYIFPVDDERMDLLDTATNKFYFNPYTGHFSLKFKRASRGARGGILADEMGLGKTIQMASLILTNQPEEDEASSAKEDSSDDDDDGYAAPRQISLSKSFAAARNGAFASMDINARRKLLLESTESFRGMVTLVVAPMSLVGQWRDEMERSIPTMNTMLYYAESKGDLVARLASGTVDIVVTSYGTLVSEYKRFIATKDAATAASSAPLYAVDWLRVILDEAHLIKNKATQNSRACRDLSARRRWCLTGTPIVNRLTDLYSLLRFLRVEPWGDFAFFNSFIAKPFMQKSTKALEIVQVVLESVLMRREKKMKDKDGKPIVDLPPKTTYVVRLSFTPLEREIYKSVYQRAYMQYQTLAAAGTVSRNFTFIFSVLMRLRQAVCHPLLVVKGSSAARKKPGKIAKESSDDEESDDDLQATALGEQEDKIKELVAAFQAGSNSLNVDDRKGALEKLGADVLKELFGKPSATSDTEEAECPFCFEEKSDLLVMPCKHWGCKACILEHMEHSEERGEDEARCPTCRKGPVTMSNVASVTRTRRNRIAKVIASSQEAAKREAEDDPDGADSEPSASQPEVLVRTGDLRSSTKLEKLVEHLNQLRYDDPTFKGVIFSQFTSFLDLVEVVLRKNHHPFVRLDGTTSQKDREAVLRSFATAPKRMLILVSLRAGGVGLNLVAANHVWLLDCWWNSSTEEQAVDRIHRLGQTRPVSVHRYLIDDSIEDRILAIQARKTALVGAALAGTRPGEKSEALQNLELLFS